MATAFTARVLVVAERPSTSGALAARLEELGVSTVIASGDRDACAMAASQPVDAALIDATDRDAEAAAGLARAMRLAARPRLLSVVVILPPDAVVRPFAEHFDAVLRAPAHPAQIAARIQLVLRVTVMEDETRLRAQTLAARNVDVDLGVDEHTFDAPQILYVGEPTPRYLALQRGLADCDARVTACFSTFSAFDFLHERDFDAVVLNAIDATEPAFTICGGLKRNTRLYHLPVVLMTDIERFKPIDEAFERGASDLLPHDASPDELARRVLSLARERRRRDAVKAAFSRARGHDPSDDVVDITTGLATAQFFVDHLDTMARRARAVSRPLSLILVRVATPQSISRPTREDTMRQIGGMVRHLVRAEDLAARVQGSLFAVAMPGAPYGAAKAAAKRLESVGECTAFEGDDFEDPFQVKMESVVAELEPSELGSRFLSRLMDEFRAHAQAS